MTKLRVSVFAAFLGFVALGASSTTDQYGQRDRSNPLQRSEHIWLDERGMVAAIGSEPVRAYRVDGGYGLHFHTIDLPAFVLEYRADRTKVAWMQFNDELGKHGPSNDLNKRRARQVLNYALGLTATAQVMAAVERGDEIRLDVLGRSVDVTAGNNLVLVTIFHASPAG